MVLIFYLNIAQKIKSIFMVLLFVCALFSNTLINEAVAEEFDIDKLIDSEIISYNRECSEKVIKKVFVGRFKKYKFKKYSGEYSYYEDYVMHVIGVVSEIFDNFNVTYGVYLSESNVAFFSDALYKKGNFPDTYINFSDTYIVIKELFFKDSLHMSDVIDNYYNDTRSILLNYRNKKYQGHVYCGILEDVSFKQAFSMIPSEYESNKYLASRDCLRLSVLRMFCVNINAENDQTKSIIEMFFTYDGDLTEYGRAALKRLKHMN